MVAVVLCALITVIASQWLIAFDAANLVMVYLLGVVVVALFYGRWPSVLATVINVISFDLFSLLLRADACCLGRAVHSDLCRDAYRRAGDRESDGRRALPGTHCPLSRAAQRHLYEMSKSLAVGRTQRDIVQTSEQFIRSTFHASNLIFAPRRTRAPSPADLPFGDDALG